jgi:hypothetical protein
VPALRQERALATFNWVEADIHRAGTLGAQDRVLRHPGGDVENLAREVAGKGPVTLGQVFGGSGMTSGVCTVARRSAALRRVGLKLRIFSVKLAVELSIATHKRPA